MHTGPSWPDHDRRAGIEHLGQINVLSTGQWRKRQAQRKIAISSQFSAEYARLEWRLCACDPFAKAIIGRCNASLALFIECPLPLPAWPENRFSKSIPVADEDHV